MTTTSRLERATARPLRPLNRPGVHAQEGRPFQAQSGKQTLSLCVCALDMVWGKQPQQRNWRRPYTVCAQCTRWIWTDRIPARPVCECGCKFPNHGHKARQGGKTKQSAAVEALPSAAQDLQGKMRAVLQSFIGTLPREQKEQFLSDFPAVSGKKKANKGDSDPYQRVSASCAEAFKNFKRLAEKKRAIEGKATKLQEQLEKLSEDLAKTTAELEEAQEVHDRELKSYASVVQQGSGAQGCPIPPYDDDDDLASSITGDEEDMDTKDKFSGVSVAPEASDTQAAATPTSSQPAAAASSSASARQPAETEEFRAFRQGLSEEQREVLDRQLQQAAQQKKPTAREAKDLMDTARLMAGFAQAIQTTSGG